jgi:hypothetical protein
MNRWIGVCLSSINANAPAIIRWLFPSIFSPEKIFCCR